MTTIRVSGYHVDLMMNGEVVGTIGTVRHVQLTPAALMMFYSDWTVPDGLHGRLIGRFYFGNRRPPKDVFVAHVRTGDVVSPYDEMEFVGVE